MPAEQQRLLQQPHPVTVGYCIYCGANEGDLSKEHVVAFALGGKVIPLKASCSECAAITSKFEHFVARRQLGPYRIRTDLPTRHPDQRPTHLPLGLIDPDGGLREVEVPSSEHPSTLILPILAQPKILSLPGEARKETFGMVLLVPAGSDIPSLPQRHSASAIRLGSFEILSFCQLLAKFAHGAAFAQELDWTVTWEPLLPI